MGSEAGESVERQRMGLIPLPRFVANDNHEPEGWFCVPCSNSSFILEMLHGSTHILCAHCGADVTAAVLPTLSREDQQCRP